MKALVTTLSAPLAAADALYEQGRLGAALTAYRDLLDQAQDKADRTAEAVARAMVARCLLQVPEEGVDGVEEAEHHLGAVAYFEADLHVEAQARLQGTRARMAGGQPALLTYLRWADERGHSASIVDACVLLSRSQRGEDRAMWLSRAVEEAEAAGRVRQAGMLALELGGILDADGRLEEAARAYGRAFEHQVTHGSPRGAASAAWAKGNVQARIEDDGEARVTLEEAVKRASAAEEARDILALALADLARVHEAAGDVVEARRLVIRAVGIAREEGLPSLWPERWRSLVAYGRSLELEV